MNYIIKKIKLGFFILLTLFLNEMVLAKENNLKYQKQDVANYLSGLVTLKKNDFEKSFKYLKKIENLKGKHYNYNAQFIRSLILLNKFEEAFTFANDTWKEDELFFEADLLLGIKYFLKEDYDRAKKYFKKTNKISKSNLLFEDFFGNIFLSWIEAINKNQEKSFKIVNNIPDRFNALKKVQIAFLNGYFETEKVKNTYKQIIENKNYNFPRYNFFLANYLITKKESINSEFFNNIKNDHLLIKELKGFIKTKKINKISNFFNHKKPTDALAEIFYIMANMYSTEKDYKSSNFYLNISLFLNNEFVPNKALLAENYFFLKNYKKSKQIYNEIKKIGPTYSWHASKNISIILATKDNKQGSILSLEKDFKLIFNPSSEIHYEMGNFYKQNEIYEKAIKHYTSALRNLKDNHYLFPEILKMRATCYERTNDWEKAEKDFLESLKLNPEQPYTLNYLAYSWIEKKINITKALKMLKKAVIETEDDPYIIDSLGWAYYNLKNFKEAKKYLQRAVQLLPLDPTVNDHYADSLWQLDKKIQAVYFWKHVLLLDDVEEKLRDNIDEKIIFGISNNL